MFFKQYTHSPSYVLWQSLAGLMLALTLLAGCGGSSGPTTSTTPTASVGSQFSPLDLGLPKQVLEAPITGTVPDSQLLHVSITFKINQSTLNSLGVKNKVPSGKNINVQATANALGISDATYQKIKAFFGVKDATLKLSALHTDLTIDALAGSFARLLQTRFVTHKLNGRSFFTPDPAKPPMIPSAISSYILAVTGLDNYSLPPQTGVSLRASQATHPTRAGADCTVDDTVVTPDMVASAYGYNQFWKAGWHGENMTANLVEIDGFDSNDLANYFACVDYKGKFAYANIDGGAPAPGGEAMLDIEMLAGLAPSANINDYQTDISQAQTNSDVWTQVNDELQQIISDNTHNTSSGSVVSISLGTAEAGVTTDNIEAINQSLQILTQVEHMTVFIASGDCGAFASRVYNDLAVSFPASDPWAVAVGGTTLTTNAAGQRADEIVWSDGSNIAKCTNQWGSGGGLSIAFPQPTWQQGNGVRNHYSNGERQLPDVAAVANEIPIYYQGQWQAVGGTSAATPIWAAGMLMVNQGMIARTHTYYYSPDTFYEAADHPGKFHPFYNVTQGNNLFYSATAGWNYTTGLGTPNLVDFFRVLYQD